MKLFISLVILLLFGAVVPLIVSKKSKSGLVHKHRSRHFCSISCDSCFVGGCWSFDRHLNTLKQGGDLVSFLQRWF
jgi:hypothetical protein